MSEALPKYLEVWKLYLWDGLRLSGPKSAVPVFNIEKRLNNYIKEQKINSPKIPAKDIKKIYRKMIAEGWPIGIVNRSNYYRAADELDMNIAKVQVRSIIQWANELLEDWEKVDYNKKWEVPVRVKQEELELAEKDE